MYLPVLFGLVYCILFVVRTLDFDWSLLLLMFVLTFGFDLADWLLVCLVNWIF